MNLEKNNAQSRPRDLDPQKTYEFVSFVSQFETISEKCGPK